MNNTSKPTVVVTGGAGYIGAHTIIALLENTSFQVISIDNFSNSSSKTFERIEQITGKKVHNFAVDLCDKTAVKTAFDSLENVIGIIHFAALMSVPDSVKRPLAYYHNNIESMINVLEMAEKFQIPNFIFSSSCSVYGNIETLPVKESTPMGKAESPYAYTKQVGEALLKDVTNSVSHIQAIALRYFNPVGAHESGLIGDDPDNKPFNLVPIVTQTAIGAREKMMVYGSDYATRDGSCVRDYVHVMDIAEAHVKALQYLINKQNEKSFSVLNLGTGNGVSVFEAIASFEKVSGVKLNYEVGARRPGDVSAIYSNTELSQQVLNWTPKYSLDDMMLSAWKWQKNLANLK